jgi:hypothetical protein
MFFFLGILFKNWLIEIGYPSSKFCKIRDCEALRPQRDGSVRSAHFASVIQSIPFLDSGAT